VQLLADRARAVCPDFAVRPENAAAVAALCRRLEGVPLAIELAAARAAVLTPEQMIARLDGSAYASPVLTHTSGDAHERHRSLRATLDWSYRLLSPVGATHASPLQRFFARLSVFRGGWTEEAAEAVCDEPLALDDLAQLRDCSLVLTETFRVRGGYVGPADPTKTGGHPAQPAPEAGPMEVRFRMLETLREYASAQLQPAERAELERRHAEYYIALLDRQWRNLVGPQQPVWFERFGREMENLRLACDWSIEANELELALRLGAMLCWFLGVRGHSAEARARAERILALPGASLPSAGRARVLQAAGLQAFWQGDHTAARTYYEESLEMFQRLGRQEEVATQLHFQGSVAHLQSDYATAAACYEQSAAIARPWGDSMVLAATLHSLGDMARLRGHYSAARDLLKEARACYSRLGLPMGVAWLLWSLSELASDLGDWPEAERLCEHSLEVARELGNRWHVATALTGLGRISGVRGGTERAVVLIEQGLRIYRETGRAVGEARALHELGCVARRRGDLAQAEQCCRQALTIRCAVGHRAGAVDSLRALAALAADADDPRRAVPLLGAAERFAAALGLILPPAFQTAHEACLRSLRAALGERGFAADWHAGEVLDWEEAVAYALGERDLPASAPGAGGDAFLGLTDAQWAAIRSVLPPRSTGGRPRVDDRRALNGLLYLVWSGCRWRHRPREYGSPATCWRRLNEWRASGVWEQIRSRFLATLDAAARSEWGTLLAARPAPAQKGRRAQASRPAAGKQQPS
jgi:transposase/tetratricopeptide (TPR) repeat protein